MKSHFLSKLQPVAIADGLAAALVVSLPWSTSLTGILAFLWLIAALPTLSADMMRREVGTLAGGLPVALWALGVLGMLWADVPFRERMDGLSGFHKLLLIPVLLAYFRVSKAGRAILIGFMASCTMLMITSWMLYFFYPKSLGDVKPVGVPVKDYISQSAFFTIVIFICFYQAIAQWRERKIYYAALALLLSIPFIWNIIIIATSRTAFVAISALMIICSIYMKLRLREVAILAAGAMAIMVAVWPSSIMQHRIATLPSELLEFKPEAASTSAGERMEFWRKSLTFIAEAPVLGHGTGSIGALFRKAAEGQPGMKGTISNNPHNQTLAVAVQLGAAGAVVLFAMWGAHAFLFRGGGIVAFIGFLIVMQNIVSSLFNSHIFDFTHGWLYVLGVGIAGGLLSNPGGDKHRTQPISASPQQ